MKKNTFTKKALQDKKILTEIYAKNAKNIVLSEQVIQLLAHEFQLHILNCSYYQQTLILRVSSQLIASKLRYSLPQVRAKLQQFDSFRDIRKIKLQVGKTELYNKTSSKGVSKPQYSNDSAEMLMSFSDSIDDADLQHSLQKLAKHVKPQ